VPSSKRLDSYSNTWVSHAEPSIFDELSISMLDCWRVYTCLQFEGYCLAPPKRIGQDNFLPLF
jgi:hypothetical protein